VVTGKRVAKSVSGRGSGCSGRSTGALLTFMEPLAETCDGVANSPCSHGAHTGRSEDRHGCGEYRGGVTVVLFVVGILVMIVGLAVSIALHELGHLWPAKRFGVRVGQYMIGFGPTLWSRRIGETEYGVKA